MAGAVRDLARADGAGPALRGGARIRLGPVQVQHGASPALPDRADPLCLAQARPGTELSMPSQVRWGYTLGCPPGRPFLKCTRPHSKWRTPPS